MKERPSKAVNGTVLLLRFKNQQNMIYHRKERDKSKEKRQCTQSTEPGQEGTTAEAASAAAAVAYHWQQAIKCEAKQQPHEAEQTGKRRQNKKAMNQLAKLQGE